jgi:hypothetical protein
MQSLSMGRLHVVNHPRDKKTAEASKMLLLPLLLTIVLTKRAPMGSSKEDGSLEEALQMVYEAGGIESAMALAREEG